MTDRFIYFDTVMAGAKAPNKATTSSVGYDLCTIESGIVWPFRAKMFETGLQFFMDPDQHFTCVNRSSVFKRGLTINNSPIDPDYRWRIDRNGQLKPLTWKLLVRNMTLLPIKVAYHERLAQIILPNDTTFDWVTSHPRARYVTQASEWNFSRRGGIGSTGRQ